MENTMSSFIGAVITGLIVAAYLAKAKVDVCVVELQDMVGGCGGHAGVDPSRFKHDPAGPFI